MSQLMNSLAEKESITSRVIKTEHVNWKSFRYIQQDDFKELPKEASVKLKASILANNFTQPFYVWHDQSDGQLYCLDGRHRTRMLEELEKEGVSVPETLPGTFIDCQNKSRAAELVLVYSSIYAKVTEQGLFDFIKLYDIDFNEI